MVNLAAQNGAQARLHERKEGEEGKRGREREGEMEIEGRAVKGGRQGRDGEKKRRYKVRESKV